MPTQSYKGNTFRPTRTTTDVRRAAFGRSYTAIAQVWEVDGPQGKPAGQRPFLTSAASCRDYINTEIDRADAAAEEQAAATP